MSSVLISIIIPVYNVEPYLRRCLDSILAQTNTNWEVIIVDDGSTDKSVEICDEYALKCSRIKVIHQDNKGVSSARNTGIDCAKGKWIWFVDADDEIVLGSIELLDDFIKNNDCDTIFSGLTHIFDNGIEYNECPQREVSNDKDFFLSHHFAYQNGMILFSRRIIENNKIRYDEMIKIGEDLQFQYNYLMWCKTPVSCGRSLYRYYHREGSAMLSKESLCRRMHDSIEIVNTFINIIISERLSYKYWLSNRLTKLIKAGLQSASRVTDDERHKFNIKFKKCFTELNKTSYYKALDRTIKIAYHYQKIYYFLIRTYMKLSNWRKQYK